MVVTKEMVTSASVCLVHLFLLAAVKLSCSTDLKTTVQMWDGWNAIQSLEELNFTVFWFWRNFLLRCTLEDMFQILVGSKLLIPPPECVCHACQRVNDHHVLCILAQSHPTEEEGGESLLSQRDSCFGADIKTGKYSHAQITWWRLNVVVEWMTRCVNRTRNDTIATRSVHSALLRKKSQKAKPPHNMKNNKHQSLNE